MKKEIAINNKKSYILGEGVGILLVTNGCLLDGKLVLLRMETLSTSSNFIFTSFSSLLVPVAKRYSKMRSSR